MGFYLFIYLALTPPPLANWLEFTIQFSGGLAASKDRRPGAGGMHPKLEGVADLWPSFPLLDLCPGGLGAGTGGPTLVTGGVRPAGTHCRAKWTQGGLAASTAPPGGWLGTQALVGGVKVPVPRSACPKLEMQGVASSR